MPVFVAVHLQTFGFGVEKRADIIRNAVDDFIPQPVKILSIAAILGIEIPAEQGIRCNIQGIRQVGEHGHFCACISLFNPGNGVRLHTAALCQLLLCQLFLFSILAYISSEKHPVEFAVIVLVFLFL